MQSHIGVKGVIQDANTGQPLEGTAIKVRNVTSGRNQDIDHDVLSGKEVSKEQIYQLLNFQLKTENIGDY